MSKPSLTLLEIAAAYAFEVKYIEPLDRWTIKGRSTNGVEFFWESTQNENMFYEELASFFRQDGVESVYPY